MRQVRNFGKFRIAHDLPCVVPFADASSFIVPDPGRLYSVGACFRVARDPSTACDSAVTSRLSGSDLPEKIGSFRPRSAKTRDQRSPKSLIPNREPPPGGLDSEGANSISVSLRR